MSRLVASAIRLGLMLSPPHTGCCRLKPPPMVMSGPPPGSVVCAWIVSCMAWVTLWSLSSSVTTMFSAGRREVFVAVVSRVALPLYRSCGMELGDRLRVRDVCWIYVRLRGWLVHCNFKSRCWRYVSTLRKSSSRALLEKEIQLRSGICWKEESRTLQGGFLDSTPLMQAEEGGHDEIMRLLLDQSVLVLGEDHYHE